MAALHRLPGVALALLLVGSILHGIANGCGVDKHVGTLESHQARCLGIPLVPAHHDSQTAHRCADGVEAQVAGGEVELLVVAGVVGDVHLAILAGYGSVLLDDDSRVVVQSGGTTLEQRGDNDHAILAGQGSVNLGRGTGNRFGIISSSAFFGAHSAPLQKTTFTFK